MKNHFISFNERRGYFFKAIFKDIYFVSNNSVCHTRITHVANFAYAFDISFISKYF